MERYIRILQYAPKHPAVPLLMEAAERLSETDRQTPSGKMIMSYVNLPKAVEIGEDMADGDLYDVNGQLHRLAELKGEYILLDFWSTGCGPCVASFPEIEEVARLYAGCLTVVGINEDSESSWKAFIRRKNPKGLQWNQLGKSDHTLKQTYRIDATPFRTQKTFYPSFKYPDLCFQQILQNDFTQRKRNIHRKQEKHRISLKRLEQELKPLFRHKYTL